MDTKIKLVDLEKSQAKVDKIINKIIANPDKYDKEQLQKIVDSMERLIKKATDKLGE